MIDVVELLTKGRERIRTRGWMRSDFAGLTAVQVPMEGVDPKMCQCLGLSVAHHTEAGQYVAKALGLKWDDETRWQEIWKLNDSQSPETGQAWAMGVLTVAIELAKQDQEVTQ